MNMTSIAHIGCAPSVFVLFRFEFEWHGGIQCMLISEAATRWFLIRV